MRQLALALLLFVSAPFPARAVEVADAPGATKQALALAVLTFAPGDRAVGELVKSALWETGLVKIVPHAQGAQLIAKLTIARGRGNVDLDLSVFARGGALLVQVRERVPPAGKLSEGARSIARQVAAALRGEPAEADAQPPSAAAPPLPATPRPRAAATPGSEAAGAGSFVAEVPVAQAPPAAPQPGQPAPRKRAARAPAAAVRDEDESGPRAHFGPETESNHIDFIAGLSVAAGPWSADSAKLASSSSSGFDLTHYAPGFTRTLEGNWHGGVDLHAGMRFLGYCSFEAAFQSAVWGGNNGVALKGIRFAGYPLAAVLPSRRLDLGLEFGAGHAFVAAGPYDMSGPYVTLGLTGEYAITRWLGVLVYYRLVIPLLTHFYVDYRNDLGEPTSVVATYWNTLGVGLSVHPSVSW